MTVAKLNEIDETITLEDIYTDIDLNVYSCYGGMKVGTTHVSILDEFLEENEDKQLNVDFIIKKN